MNFRELVEKKLTLKKGKEYHIFPTDEPDFEANNAWGTYIGTGKGRLSPNKGKDVYIFKATKDADAYIDGKFKVGLAFVEDGTTTIEEA